ncbi:MAG: metal-dependent transcriptional regulator [Clostridiales bacterium]|jgi:DtxR family Mn-dependent transcriptional regulator|nr:metal-dependent transcriptional regulator [Clostridiales bacterium]
MKMQESGENYLETILLLKQKQGFVRSIDVAETLGYSKPSISRAMGLLKENGYVEIESSGNIQFTQKGKEKAEAIYERHRLITDYFVKSLGVDPATAEADACRIEHVISQSLFDHIKRYIQEH